VAEGQKTRWVIKGKGHWIMAAAAFLITLFSGHEFVEAIRGETSWLVGIGSFLFCAFFWLLSLRAKPIKD
jgi:hypothetical protein